MPKNKHEIAHTQFDSTKQTKIFILGEIIPYCYIFLLILKWGYNISIGIINRCEEIVKVVCHMQSHWIYSRYKLVWLLVLPLTIQVSW